jgi:hypothetical protein
MEAGNTIVMCLLVLAGTLVFGTIKSGKFAETFKEFPPVQKPNTFTVNDALAKMSDATGGAGH